MHAHTLKGTVVTLVLLIIGWMKIAPFFECVGDSGNRGIMEASDSFLGDGIHIVKIVLDIIHFSSSQVLLIK